jgi:glucose/mannose transport system permease protein
MASFHRTAQSLLPKLVVSPSLLSALIFIYGFIAITAYMSFTESRMMPNWEWAGLDRYEQLFGNERWWQSARNLGIFGGLFIGLSMGLGLLLAIFLDQKIRIEGGLRAIFLYPMALSFVVTGTAWKWLLNPGLGLEKLMHDWGWTSFSFDWLVNSEMSIYCVVIAGVWQSIGFTMALCLAGLRSVDSEMIKAAQMDGANQTTIYRRIILPCMKPVFFSVALMLSHIAIKSFDLVMALTSGGPGTSSDVPAIFMYQFTFTRGQLGVGAAASMMMLMTVAAIAVPLMYAQTKSTSNI